MLFKIMVCIFLFIIVLELQEIANNTRKELTEHDVDRYFEEVAQRDIWT